MDEATFDNAAAEGAEHVEHGSDDGTYFLMYRSICRTEYYLNPDLLQALIFCLKHASFKKRSIPVTEGRVKKFIELSEGQFITGRNAAGKELGVPARTIWDRLKKMESLGTIAIESNNYYSIISVCNWTPYQRPQIASRQGFRQGVPPSTRHQSTTNKEGLRKNKNVRESAREHVPPKPPDGTPPTSTLEVAFPPELDTTEARQMIDIWLAYKAERREAYKPVGLKAFIGRTANLVKLHGLAMVSAAMERAKASGWKGYDYDGAFPAVSSMSAVTRYVDPNSDEAQGWTP